MKYYLAPMEGITGYIYRNAYEKTFHNIDKYFTPFIVANESKSLKTKELKDVLPENNNNLPIIPQILTNSCDAFNATCERLLCLGYDEVNINLGCPSGTVVSKNKGSGFLALREELNSFLEGIFTNNKVKISIKTRIGKDSPDEFKEILKIYNEYPLEELIIHPRIQKDFYKNTPNMQVFSEGIKLSKNSVCYNGDIYTAEDYTKIVNEYHNLQKVMLGRGIISNPGLVSKIKEGKSLDKETFIRFHNEVLYGYVNIIKDDKNVLFKMKELWFYMASLFDNSKKYVKEIKKCQKIDKYIEIVQRLTESEEISEG